MSKMTKEEKEEIAEGLICHFKENIYETIMEECFSAGYIEETDDDFCKDANDIFNLIKNAL
jgi:hypothetical protein